MNVKAMETTMNSNSVDVWVYSFSSDRSVPVVQLLPVIYIRNYFLHCRLNSWLVIASKIIDSVLYADNN